MSIYNNPRILELEQELTPKQVEFVKKYLGSFNKVESYKEVYDCKDSTANSESTKTLKNPKIQEYISELKNYAFEATGNPFFKRLRALSKIAFNEAEKTADRINAIKELNKLEGVYAADRLEVSGPDGESIDTDKTFKIVFENIPEPLTSEQQVIEKYGLEDL